MDSAESNTILPRWAIGPIFLACALLVALATIIVIMCKKNQNKDRKNGYQIEFGLSKSNSKVTTAVDPLYERIRISPYNGFSAKHAFLFNMKNDYNICKSGATYKFNLSEFSSGLFSSMNNWDFTPNDIKVLLDTFSSEEDSSISDETKKLIADALNEFKKFIDDEDKLNKDNPNEDKLNKDVAKKLIECVNKIDELKRKVAKDIQPLNAL